MNFVEPLLRQKRPGFRWLAGGGLLLGAALLIVVLALGFGRDPNAIQSPLINQPAPQFSLTTLDRHPISLRALRGHPVLVNFWAPWCTGCHVEHPLLLSTWHRYRRQGVQIVGIVFQDNRADVLSYLRQNGGSWPQAADPGQHTALDYGVYGVPETFFIDRQGYIRDKSTGAVSAALLRRVMPRLVG